MPRGTGTPEQPAARIPSGTTVDLFDPALFRNGPPHDVFDALRLETPVYWNARASDPGGGFWVLTRYADVLAVSRDTTRFTSSQGFSAPRDAAVNPALAEGIMFRDPPDHTKHRRPLNRCFTPKAMVGLEPTVRSIALQILDGISHLEDFDAVPKIAAELPARVVAAVLGVPEADHGKLVEWASDIFGRDGSAERQSRFEGAVQSIVGYAESLKGVKRACPADDVMSLLLSAQVDGSPLTETVLSMWFLSLAQAGFETTHTLIAQGLRLLCERPDLREQLICDRDAIPRAVEEMLRFITPVNMMARTAVQEVRLGDHTIRPGEYVTMWYAATNRDPAVFDAPHEFEIDRSPNNHQSFGAAGSAHFCLGAHLARLEMRVLLEELCARGFPYAIAGSPIRAPGVFINALSSLPMSTSCTA